MKNYIGVFLIAILGGVLGAGVVKMVQKDKYVYLPSQPAVQLAKTTSTGASKVETPDFINASSATTPAVVHIKSYVEGSKPTGRNMDPFRDFFGDRFDFDFEAPDRQSAGSGVIVSSDGFITTNNHVVEGADRVEVILNDKRTYEAKVIGTDPTTDLAVLKIEEKQLPYLSFGNSDNVRVGEWVLAVGNPFNLTSTVTAGIVSAKGRSLNILDEEYRIESFIQTDAAVNPGNSGGALVNTLGELVGINTAIASRTGSFSGYSFAVPSNLVKKVVSDLKEFGKVQRGLIGIQIRDIDSKFAEENDLNMLAGVYVSGLFKDGAADKAGIREGDIITHINETEVNTASELQGMVGTYRPGDEIVVKMIREGDPLMVSVQLQNMEGTTAMLKLDDSEEVMTVFGAELHPLTDKQRSKMDLQNGVEVKEVNNGLFAEIGIGEGFIITKVNKQAVNSPKAVDKLLKQADRRVSIEGIDRNGTMMHFNFSR